jgi:hypothetical protein
MKGIVSAYYYEKLKQYSGALHLLLHISNVFLQIFCSSAAFHVSENSLLKQNFRLVLMAENKGAEHRNICRN